MSNSDLESTANMLINEFSEGSRSQKEVQDVVRKDPFVELKLDLVAFFKERMSRISSQETLKAKIEEELLALLERSELTFDELMRFYKTVAVQSNESANSLIELFKPTPGAPSILATNLSEPEDKRDIYDSMYEKFSSDHLQAIDKLHKVIESFTVKKEETPLQEDE